MFVLTANTPKRLSRFPESMQVLYLKPPMIDTHCHLNDQEAFPNPQQAIQEALDAGVRQLIVIGIDEEWSRIAIELADQNAEVFATVGWHPTSAAKYDPKRLTEIHKLAQHPKCVAIGEIGLDFHWDFSSPAQQFACLNDHLDLAQQLDLPIVFHCREAYPQLLDLLETRPVQPYLLHCFAGNQHDAERAIKLNAFFGIDGPITYKKADDLRQTVAKIGIERLVLETDAPWLSPVPFRGKPNHPKYLCHIRDGLAATLDLTPEQVETQTTLNAKNFFRLPH